MTWGEIQVVSLEKIFAKDEPIMVADLEKLRADDDCKWYLSAMPAVCNEAIHRIKPYIQNMYSYNDEEGSYEKSSIDSIDSETDDNYELDLVEDACRLVPLYIASQLYKDDDISQATAYRNEFEVGLQDLIYNVDNPNTIRAVF